MTDHNVLVSHRELPGLLTLTGLEHDIEYSPDKCTHVVGLTPAGREATAYPCRRYSALELTDQDLVNLMVRDGQFVSLAHPVWSRMEPHEILALKGFHAIEVFNNATAPRPPGLRHGGGRCPRPLRPLRRLGLGQGPGAERGRHPPGPL